MIFDALSEMFIQGAAKKGLDVFKDKRSPHTKELLKTINQTIEEFTEKHPIARENRQQMAFYDSQAIVDELLKFRFFGDYPYGNIIKILDSNPNILYKKEQVEAFLQLFHQKTQENETLKQLEINENFKNEIYRISEKQEQHFQLSQKSYKLLEEIKNAADTDRQHMQEQLDQLKEILNAVLLSQKVNKIEVSGNNNLILQDINGSDIDISAIQNPEIQKYLTGFAKDEFRLYNKVFVYCHPSDRFFWEQYVQPKLQEAEIPVYTDIKDIRMADFKTLDNIIRETRKTLVICSKNMLSSRNDSFYFEGFMQEQQAHVTEKLLPLTLTGDDCVPGCRRKPLDLSRPDTLDNSLNQLTNQLRKAYGMKIQTTYFPPLPDVHIDITRLPYGGVPEPLYGRQKELDLLDKSWAENQTNLLVFVAEGGVGKSALTNRWVAEMRKQHFRGAQKVFAWSFYSQGAGEKVTSAEQFISTALQWLGATGFENLSDWDKGRLLAKKLNRHRSLLILDGLEPLQEPSGIFKGQVKDAALREMLKALSKHNSGLCLVSTRIALRPEIPAQSVDLERISPEAGKIILRRRRISGTDNELHQLVRNFGGHALAINLLAEYIYRFPNHPAAEAKTIPDLPHIPENKGRHARRVIAALHQHLLDKNRNAEAEILSLSGLFDRPFEEEAIEVLIQPDKIYEKLPKTKKQTQNPLIKQVMDKFNVYTKEDLLKKIDEEIESDKDKVDVSPLIQFREMVKNDKDVEIPIEYPQLKSPLNFSKVSNFSKVLENLRNYQLFYPKSSHEPHKIDCHPLIREHFAEVLKEKQPKTWQQANRILYEYFKNKAPHQPDTLPQMQPLFRAVAHGCRAQMHQQALDDVYWERIRHGKANFLCTQLGAFGSDLACLSHFFDEIWHTPAANLPEREKAMVLSWAGFRLRAVGRTDQAIEAMEAGLELIVKSV